MPGHPRLYRRGATYYHRAAVPVDIKDTYPKSEETFSLKTKDRQEALRRVRIAAVDADRRFDAHRRELSLDKAPRLEALTDQQIKDIGHCYYVHLMEEDEEARLAGFGEQRKRTVFLSGDDDINAIITSKGFAQPSFEEHVEANEWILDRRRDDYRQGKIEAFYLEEAQEVLTWSNVNLRLSPKSDSLRKLARELQIVSIRASEDIAARNMGRVVDTPVDEEDAKVTSQPLLSVAVEDWAGERSRTSWNEKTEREHRVWMGHFVALIGDRPLSNYTKTDARHFKSTLLKLPANWTKSKELKGLPIGRAAERASELHLPPMSDSNVNKLIGFVGSFWSWAELNYDGVPVNIFKGMKIKRRRDVRAERDPFTPQELQSIFSAPLYTGCESTRRWQHVGEVVPRDAGIFWVPLISLFSGARMGEIIQLYTSDIREEEDVTFFDINREGADKRLKTNGSQRRIPVHPTLVDIGLLDHLERRKNSADKRLFPDLRMGKDGYYSSSFSKHFNRFLTGVGIKRPKATFHSFRHNFEDACREAGISPEIMNRLQGHVETGMSARYGSGHSLQSLNKAVQKIVYPSLDLSHLLVRKAAVT